MKVAVRSIHLRIAVLVWGSYWLFVPFLDRRELFEIVNGINFAVALGVLVAFTPGVWNTLRLPLEEHRPGNYLVLGIWTVCLGYVAQRVWGWAWRLMHMPTEMIDHPVFSFFLWMISTGYVIHLASSGAIDNAIPPRAYVRAGIIVAIGALFGVFILTAIV